MTLKGSRMLSGADEGRSREGSLGRNKDRKRHGRRGGRRFTGPVLVVCALLAVLAALDQWSNAGKVYPGVEVGGVPLGGKTPEEAREALEERASEALGETEFVGPGGGFSLTRGDMGIDHDVAASVEEAYAVGRRGGIVERLGERLRTAFGTVGVPPEVEYEPEVARLAVEDAARRVNEGPRNASVAVVGGEVEVKEAKYGYALDVPRTMRNVEEALHGLSGEVAIAGERLEPEIPTQEAERAAEKARTAISEPMILSAEGREWELSSAAVGRVLSFVPGGKRSGSASTRTA